MTPKAKEQEPDPSTVASAKAEAPARGVSGSDLSGLGVPLGQGWRSGSLGDFIELKRGYDLPSSVRRAGNVPIVSSSGVSGSHAEAKVKGPGVVTGRYGTIGQVFFIEEDFWPLNTTLFVRDFKGNDPQFVSYFLRTFDFNSFSDKAAVPGVNRNHLHMAQVQFPDLSEQRRILGILGSLDDKIQLNRRMNETLEAMARAIFKSWFVDFDPVRAKSEGRQPQGIPAHIADLFPDSFQDSPLGPIPSGWKRGCLGDLCKLKRGHDLPSDSRTSGEFHVVSSSGVSGTHAEAKVRGPGVVTGRYGTIGKVFFVETDYWPLNTTLYVEDFKQSPPRFIYHLLSGVDYTSYSDKAAVPGVNRNHLHQEPVTIPPMEVRQAFAELITPLHAVVAANLHESRTLAALRDTLLPKLLSGEVQPQEPKQ